PFTDLEINARSQLSILETCRRENPTIRIVFAGTRQVYGKPEYLPVDEKHLLRPVDVNGVNKMAGEWYHILYNNVYGIKTTVLRLTNTYGPCMRIKDARQTFVGVWIRQLLCGEPIEVWGGGQLRDFTYIDDCLEGLCLAATHQEAPGEIFNLGGCEVISLEELAKLLVEVNGSGEYQQQDFPADRKQIDIGDYYADDQQIRTRLGWEPRVTLREGLQKTLDYYRERLDSYL
ncbi:MAG: NAD-dependent epimerase/dehydratase family protein, partial [Planctomycetaceae bacterium]|nr:NAD-dependent epimerase/dehydratase family protein [Planctomycetaceae bacterium]